MKKLLSAIVAATGLVVLAGVATAQWGAGPMGGRFAGMGSGMMGTRGSPASGAGHDCPGYETTTAEITEEKAKELGQQYADQYLKGFTVERVLPFTGRHHTMYSVELKNQQGEVRTLHINPFGNVMPFGGPWRRS